MTQGKIERYHRSMKNRILLDNYYLPGQLEQSIEEFVRYYNAAHLSMSLIQIDLTVDFVVLRGLPGDCGRGRRDISRLRIAMLNA